MLSDQCSDISLAQNSAYIYLEIPAQGGHCGFAPKDGGSVYWSEKRAWAFCEDK
jgi:predicted alpha/beta-fold hydrolase